MSHSIAKNKVFRWLWLAVLVIVADQLSKYWMVTHFELGEQLRVFPFFNLVLAFNPGAAFSFLGTASGWQVGFFIAIGLVAAIIILCWLRQLQANQQGMAVALCLILGGALGNVLDRIHFGYVIDFVQLHYQQYYFPAFNVADSAITIGAIILIWQFIRKS